MGKKLLGFRLDYDKKSMQLYDVDGDLHVMYKGVLYPIQLCYARVDDGTFNQPVRSVPYIVLDGDVYAIRDFVSIKDNN